MRTLLFFMLAGVSGAFLRYAFLQGFGMFFGEYALLWGVFGVNIIGCFLFGLSFVLIKEKAWNARLVLVGFLGSFTTFSSYIFDMYSYIQSGDYDLLFFNSFLQIIFGIILLRIGMYCAHKLFTGA